MRIISRVSGREIIENRNKGPDSEHLLRASLVDLALSKNSGVPTPAGWLRGQNRICAIDGNSNTAPKGNPQIPIPGRQQPGASQQKTRSQMSSSLPASPRCLSQGCTLGALHPLRTQTVATALVLGELCCLEDVFHHASATLCHCLCCGSGGFSRKGPWVRATLSHQLPDYEVTK